METVPADVALTFEVTFDSNALPVGMVVQDTTGDAPWPIVQGPTAMTVARGCTYAAKFTATAGRSYLVTKAVYTDNTLATLDTDYVAGSETIYGEEASGGGGGGGGGSLIGIIEQNNVVIGYVEC